MLLETKASKEKKKQEQKSARKGGDDKNSLAIHMQDSHETNESDEIKVVKV